jgi:DNA-binding MarR family transcriptional regulator
MSDGAAGQGDTAGQGDEAGLAGQGDEAGQAGEAERRQLIEDFVLAMRRTGSIMQLITQAAADRIGINSTDMYCLNILALTGPMTAGELARATGLTTASITGVLDRLEEGDFVRRERDAADRRRVNIQLNFTRGLRDVAPVFAPMLSAYRAAIGRYTDDELRLIVGFQLEIEEILRDQLNRLRSAG